MVHTKCVLIHALIKTLCCGVGNKYHGNKDRPSVLQASLILEKLEKKEKSVAKNIYQVGINELLC
jgi:hypothetical protein